MIATTGRITAMLPTAGRTIVRRLANGLMNRASSATAVTTAMKTAVKIGRKIVVISDKIGDRAPIVQ